MTVTNDAETMERMLTLREMELDCLERNFTLPRDIHEVAYCPPAWDNIMCWDYTPANITATQTCSSLEFLGFENGTAYRKCMPGGHWYINPDTNLTFTDFTDCHYHEFSHYFVYHMRQIQLMANVGYSISLLVLTAAIAVLVICRKPTRPTNTMRLNLFIALALKAALGLLKQLLFYKNVAFEKDLVKSPSGVILLQFTEATHWECKLLVSLNHYAYAAVYIWILAEGVFLHCIVYDTFKANRNGVKPYIIFGWLSPLSFIIPWVIVRAVYLDQACWNATADPRSHWLLRGPILVTLCVNMIFLSRIIKALFMRLNEISSRIVMGRKLAKFTLTLFLLFGAYYVIFAVWPDTGASADDEIPKLYAEMFVNSFQGLFVSVVFCFFNDEVKTRLKSALFRNRSTSSRSGGRNQQFTPKIVAFPNRFPAKNSSDSVPHKKYIYTAYSNKKQQANGAPPDVESSSTSGHKRNGALLVAKLDKRNKNDYRLNKSALL